MRTRIFRIALLMLVSGVLLFPLLCRAGQSNVPLNIPGFYGKTFGGNSIARSIPSTKLPVQKPGGIATGISSIDVGAGLMTVNQNQPQAIIDWSSFDIGSDATVNFNQASSTWAALNRIWDTNPSMIYGHINAPGKIFLINQNGILFGPDSKINVNTLAASALNIRNIDFLNYYQGKSNVLPFYLETGAAGDGGTKDYTDLTQASQYFYDAPHNTDVGHAFTFKQDSNGNSIAAVSNFGEMTANSDQNSHGSVFLIGPLVENGGKIDALSGQIVLVAGAGTLTQPLTLTRIPLAAGQTDPRAGALLVGINDSMGGTAWNMQTGSLTADAGMAGMYGASVNHDGYIRSITAVRQNGQIELRATSGNTLSVANSFDDNKPAGIVTGAGSVIESPIQISTDTANYAYPFSGGSVSMGALQTFSNTSSSVFYSDLALPQFIVHQGQITAPSGSVTLSALNRVYLETGSSINVSGIWSDEPLSAVLMQAQLNSLELQDFYAQKGGILQGQYITFSLMGGSAIGNVNGAILAQLWTAQEKAINGGAITLNSGNKSSDGDIIVKPGARLNFAGGGIHYGGGYLNTTKVVAAGKIYDISNVPSYLRIDRILGPHTRRHERFNVEETWEGLYTGSGTPLSDHVEPFDKGGNAGSLGLYAASVVLDGLLDGSFKQGLYQTVHTPATDTNLDYDLLLSYMRGIEMPSGGAVTIDTATNSLSATSISVQQDVPAQTNLSYNSPTLTGGQPQTVISANMLNAANLSSLTLNANDTIGINANIVLLPGGSPLMWNKLDSGSYPTADQARGSFSATASRIEHYGSVTVPSGTINLQTSSADMSGGKADREIYLESGSRLDVSGQKIDNSAAGVKAPVAGQLAGGNINILDQVDLTTYGRGVFVQDNAVLDVSGGYQIDTKGKITGGDAGTLTIQGRTVMLKGDIRGYALADSQGKTQGGKVALRAFNIEITGPNSLSPWAAFSNADSIVPAGLQNTLVFAGNFADTGFTQIELDSHNGVEIDANAQLVSSLVKLKTPANTSNEVGSPVAGNPDLIRLNTQWAYQTGNKSSFTAKTGDTDDFSLPANIDDTTNADLIVSPGAVIRTAPGGKISMTTTFKSMSAITISGILEAPGGAITINADGSVDVTPTGQILAAGYKQPDIKSTPKGFGYNYIPKDGGKVTLNAGGLNLEQGSFIDISGPGIVTNRLLSAAGTPVAYSAAGNPGSLELDYGDGGILWQGTVLTGPKISGVQGAALTIKETSANYSLVVGGLSGLNLNAWAGQGFDALTLRSAMSSIEFSGPMDVTFARQLILDTPSIKHTGSDDVTLRSPWITLENTTTDPNYIPKSITPPATGSGQLTLSTRTDPSGLLSTGWIDVVGGIAIRGFQTTSLEAGRDIRLSDYAYNSVLQGQLWTAGDLLMKADRIYPAMKTSVNTGDGTSTNYAFSPSKFVLQAGVFVLSNVSSGYANNDLPGTVRIYQSDYQAGLPAGSQGPADRPVYSAGGALAVIATKGIDVEGALATPMGSITLTTAPDRSNPSNPDLSSYQFVSNSGIAPGSRIYIANSGTVTTAGNATVAYGNLDANNNWYLTTTDPSGTTQQTAVSGNLATLFPNSVAITTDQAIIAAGGRIDTSGGGGSVFPFQWREDVTGSTDPLLAAGTGADAAHPQNPKYATNPSATLTRPDGNPAYVVMSSKDIQLPGPQVYLDGGGGLNPGTYTLLPVQYAFLPGAYVVELQSGSNVLPGLKTLTRDYYPLATGHNAVADTAIAGTAPLVYSVRQAADIIAKEATYDGPAQKTVIGNSGNITVSGTTTILAGSLKAAPLAAVDPATGFPYLAGNIYLSGTNIYVRQTVDNLLPSTFNYRTDLSSLPATAGGPSLIGSMYVAASAISGGGNVYLGGDPEPTAATPNPTTITNSITIENGSTVLAPFISLWANNSIDVGAAQPGAQQQQGTLLYATKPDGTGEIDLKTTSSTGTAVIESGAVLHADHTFGFDSPNLVINGKLQVDSSAITLKSSSINFGAPNTGGTGLFITNDLWTTLMGFKDITFRSVRQLSTDPDTAGIFFESGATLSAGSGVNSLTLDAARLVNSGNSQVYLSANTVALMNSGLSSAVNPDPLAGNTGSFTVTANNINVGGVVTSASGVMSAGSNDVLFANFGLVALNSTGDLTLKGKGSLTTGNATLNINAARVTTANVTTTVVNPDKTNSTPVATADFHVYTGANYYNDQNNSLAPRGAINIAGGTAGAQYPLGTQGGSLEFRGTNITLGDNASPGVIQADAATIKLVADGGTVPNNIVLQSGSRILARGGDDAPGGTVTLQAGNSITLNGGSTIDVSAGAQGDAGKVSLSAPAGGVIIGGTLLGKANGGLGGSFVLDTSQLSDADMSKLITTLATFTEAVDIRARNGNIDVVAGQTLAAHHVKLTEDDASTDKNGNIIYDASGNPVRGNINVYGRIDASSAGGTVELYAMNNVTIQNDGAVKGGAPLAGNSNGWSVLLNSEQGSINVYNNNVNQKAIVDGGGGNIYLRAQQNGFDVNINVDNSALQNAPAVYAEAFMTYYDLSYNPSTSTWFTDANTFYYFYKLYSEARLNPSKSPSFHLLPGIEVDAPGDFTLSNALDLTTTVSGISTRYGGDPGVLTIRAAGGLTIDQNLVDHPTTMSNLSSPKRDSWGINLIAGADTNSADYMAVTGSAVGDLKIASGAAVYTESAPVRFASSHNTVLDYDNKPLAQPGYMINSNIMYNLASYAGNIQGNVGRDLIINGGAIQTATGNIDVKIGRDLQLNSYTDTVNNKILGAIRTTGQTTDDSVTDYWTYAGGGNIALNVGRSVGQLSSAGILQTAANPSAWDFYNVPSGGTAESYGQVNPTGGRFGSFKIPANSSIDFYWNNTYCHVPLTAKSYGNVFSDLVNGINLDLQAAKKDGILTAREDSNHPHFLIFTNKSKQNVTNFMQDQNGNADQVASTLFFRVGQTILGYPNPNYWSADYTVTQASATSPVGNVPDVTFNPTAGVATMGGGSVKIITGGDFLAQAGTFGQPQTTVPVWRPQGAGDNLEIYAGGNISGRFMNFNGTGKIHAAGNFGSPTENPTIELGSSGMTATAGGDMYVGKVLNPTNSSLYILQTQMAWDLTYTSDTSIALRAGGNLTYYGTTDVPYYGSSYLPVGQTTYPFFVNFLPATVDMEAAAGNIYIKSNSTNNNIVLAPSKSGNLTLKAGGTIEGYTGNLSYATIQMADITTDVYTPIIADGVSGPGTALAVKIEGYFPAAPTAYYHGNPADSGADQTPLHKSDSTPVTISAGQDIDGLNLWLPKPAEIKAGRDITDTWYAGQNVAVGDVSTIVAGRDITLLYARKQAPPIYTGFNQAGPGSLIVEAGGRIDLGSSAGITTTGNGAASYDNPRMQRSVGGYTALGMQASSLYVISGYTISALEDTGNMANVTHFITGADTFFAGLQNLGTTIQNDKSSGNGHFNTDLQAAEKSVQDFLGTPNSAGYLSRKFPGTTDLDAAGNIDMTASTIQTSSGTPTSYSFGNAGIYVIAGGSLNIGRTVFASRTNTLSSGTPQPTGIMTVQGGGVDIFAVQDVNVNESRVATALGGDNYRTPPGNISGDITIWSDQGNINAGRGAKTQVSVVGGVPVTGSGIRAVSYDPDGPGPLQALDPGNVSLLGFHGVVDAGEAGITGGKVLIGATQVVNVQNISAAGSIVGVPAAAATTTTPIGGLSGAGSATQSSQSMSDASAVAGGGRTAQAAQMIEDIMMKWLDVKVIDFVQADQGAGAL